MTTFDPTLLVKLVQQILEITTRGQSCHQAANKGPTVSDLACIQVGEEDKGETNKRKRKTNPEESENRKFCKMRKYEKGKISKTEKQDKERRRSTKEVWVTSLTENGQCKLKTQTSKVSVAVKDVNKEAITNTLVKGLEETMELEKKDEDQILGGSNLHVHEVPELDDEIDKKDADEIPGGFDQSVQEVDDELEKKEVDQTPGGLVRLVEDVPDIDGEKKDAAGDQMTDGLDLLAEEVPEIDDEFCPHLVPEIQDEFWNESKATLKKSLMKKDPTAWIDSFGIPCNLCASISDNRCDLKKHVKVAHGISLIQYKSRHGPSGPRQKFK